MADFQDLTQGPLEDTPDPSPTVREGLCFFVLCRGLGKNGVSSQGMWAKLLVIQTNVKQQALVGCQLLPSDLWIIQTEVTFHPQKAYVSNPLVTRLKHPFLLGPRAFDLYFYC